MPIRNRNMKSFSDFYNEALTVQQRRKRAVIMKRLAPKIAIKRKIAMKKKANPEKSTFTKFATKETC